MIGLLSLLLVFLLGLVPLASAYYCPAASLVIGQSSFTTNTPATTPTGLYAPNDVAFDSSGNLWVADFGSRVLEYTQPFSTDEAATLVIGQSSFTTNTPATTPTGLYAPTGVAFDHSGNLWVSDAGNNRVLEFVPGTFPCSSGKFCNDMPASLVIGQPNFMANTPATTPTGLQDPRGVAFDHPGNLWVADTGNNRVLEFGNSTCTATVTGSSPGGTRPPSSTQGSFPLALVTIAVAVVAVAEGSYIVVNRRKPSQHP